MSDTILYKSGFCCNISDRNFSALKSQTQYVIIWQTTLSPIFSAIKCQTHCVMIWQTILSPISSALKCQTHCVMIWQTILSLIFSDLKCQTHCVIIWLTLLRPILYAITRPTTGSCRILSVIIKLTKLCKGPDDSQTTTPYQPLLIFSRGCGTR